MELTKEVKFKMHLQEYSPSELDTSLLSVNASGSLADAMALFRKVPVGTVVASAGVVFSAQASDKKVIAVVKTKDPLGFKCFDQLGTMVNIATAYDFTSPEAIRELCLSLKCPSIPRQFSSKEPTLFLVKQTDWIAQFINFQRNKDTSEFHLWNFALDLCVIFSLDNNSFNKQAFLNMALGNAASKIVPSLFSHDMGEMVSPSSPSAPPPHASTVTSERAF